MSNIKIFAGHFGSGKTEIAINKAIDLAKKGKKVTIVDIDIVNPYFCVRGLKDELESYGIKVIASNPDYVNAELMVVTPEVMSIFSQDEGEVIIDVGGDEQGAVALGQFNKYFKKEGYSMHFVVNNNRPFTKDAKGTEEYIHSIERASRLKVTELVSNTNMSYETKIEDVLKGHKEVHALSKKINIPYKYLVCRRDLVDKIKSEVSVDVYGIDIFMKPPWR
ncbi:ATP-binding protein [Haloimpatiens sp. FM7330]|uniref:nucleotide-binding protein n=1 Tax=Haloimpatiens sp. FM7330 TaxID=3298610 RepID=UPI00363400E9